MAIGNANQLFGGSTVTRCIRSRMLDADETAEVSMSYINRGDFLDDIQDAASASASSRGVFSSSGVNGGSGVTRRSAVGASPRYDSAARSEVLSDDNDLQSDFNYILSKCGEKIS